MQCGEILAACRTQLFPKKIVGQPWRWKERIGRFPVDVHSGGGVPVVGMKLLNSHRQSCCKSKLYTTDPQMQNLKKSEGCWLQKQNLWSTQHWTVFALTWNQFRWWCVKYLENLMLGWEERKVPRVPKQMLDILGEELQSTNFFSSSCPTHIYAHTLYFPQLQKYVPLGV